MAFPNEVLVGRFNGVLTKVFGMKEGSPAPVLMPEITPVLVLENDRPEFHLLGGSQLAWGRGENTGGAGFNSVGLQNPIGSGALIVVEGIYLKALTITAFYVIRMYRGMFVVPATTVGIAWRDSRGMPPPVVAASVGGGLVGQIIGGNDLVLPTVVTTVRQIRTLAAQSVEMACEIVLGPGAGVLVSLGSVAATECDASFDWRERPIEASELLGSRG